MHTMTNAKLVCCRDGFSPWLISLTILIMLLGSHPLNGQVSEKQSASSSSGGSWRAWERLTDAQAWKMLPELASGDKQKLPNWTKPIVLHMPRTAAAMLELDAAFRNGGPLDAALRAKLRWIIAHSNRSAYGEALALADLRRVAGNDVSISDFTCPPSQWPASLRNEFEFVRSLSLSAPTISDSLFENLRAKHGDRGVAAMVLLTAYANYQDRILLGLQVPIESDGPYPPLNVKFVDGALQVAPLTPTVNGAANYSEQGKAVTSLPQDWFAITYSQLQARLEKQRERKPRLPVPTWDEVKGNLPTAMTARPTSIKWSLINYGYAADLAIPWTLMTRTHWAEFPSDRILEESLFWIQTRALECNYCMGHCEMLLEVAGLSKEQVARRTQLLADTDWSAFPQEEQRAYAYARKLTLTPHLLTDSDYQSLEADFGPKRAMSIFIWLCRGLYMTRISDGFQLPLERENVFAPPSTTKDPKSSSAVELVREELSPETLTIINELRSSLSGDSEAIAMLNDILKGSTLGPEDGWFPLAKAESRFDWSYVIKRYDADADSLIAPKEFSGNADDFARLDRDKDGTISESDFDWSKHSLTSTPGTTMFFRSDSDANGKVTKEEFLKLFEQLASNGDYLAIDDLRDEFVQSSTSQSNSKPRPKRADNPSPNTLVKALKNQELGSLQAGPHLDDLAPDFTLTTLDGKTVTLSAVVGEKPTVLIFGNFTCGPFRSQSGNIEKLYERYRDRCNFFLIYVREAHPSDGWWMQSNQRVGINLKQPTAYGERRAIAENCQKHLALSIPFLVDTVDDQVGSTYSGMPNRLYIVDQQGRIAFKNGRGPFGFHPRQLEQALVLLLNQSGSAQ